jgi:formiminotetrahydrofolate cyclodeaminase
MVANYSIGKSKSKYIETRLQNIIKKGTALRKRLIALIDLDAQAYLNVVKVRQGSEKTKKAALKKAAKVPREVCRICFNAIDLAPFLVEKGNKHLVSDIVVAAEMLMAAFNSAMANVEANI